MRLFADPFWGKVLISTIFAGAGVLLWFGLDIFLYLTRRDFANLNVDLVIFTRHDHKSTSDKVRFKSTGYKIPLRKVLKNEYLFWQVMVRAVFRVSLEKPVLNVGSHTYAILAPIRGHILAKSASAEFKRWGGFPFNELECQLTVVRDKSDDKSTDILTVMLIQNRDLQNFQDYVRERTVNKRNMAFIGKIKQAFDAKSGSFIDIDITAG